MDARRKTRDMVGLPQDDNTRLGCEYSRSARGPQMAFTFSARSASTKRKRHWTSVAEFGPAFGELLLEAGDDAGVHLADARFAEVERGADLLHRHVLVVVEDDDEPFVAIEAAGDQAHQVAVLQAIRWVLGLFVFEDVDLADILVAVGLVPLLAQADQADRGRVAGHL